MRLHHVGTAIVTALAVVIVPGTYEQSLRAQIVFMDDFDVEHDYSTGTVPGGSIWDGVHNPLAGGDVFDANVTTAGNLRFGIDDVAWGDGRTDGPMVFRDVPAEQLRSVRAKITSQTEGFWSVAGVIARVKAGPVDDGDFSDEFFVTSDAFLPGGDNFGGNGASLQGQNIVGGVRTEDLNTDGLTAADVAYVRLDHSGGGDFELFSSADGIDWTMRHSISNPDVAGQTLEVGLFAGDFGGDAGDEQGIVPFVEFDWVEIEVVPEPASLWLAGIAGLIGIAHRVRRKRRRN